MSTIHTARESRAPRAPQITVPTWCEGKAEMVDWIVGNQGGDAPTFRYFNAFDAVFGLERVQRREAVEGSIEWGWTLHKNFALINLTRAMGGDQLICEGIDKPGSKPVEEFTGHLAVGLYEAGHTAEAKGVEPESSLGDDVLSTRVRRL